MAAKEKEKRETEKVVSIKAKGKREKVDLGKIWSAWNNDLSSEDRSEWMALGQSGEAVNSLGEKVKCTGSQAFLLANSARLVAGEEIATRPLI